jgi:predicted nucleic acid-binding protein
MRESCTSGSARGAGRNACPYRDPLSVDARRALTRDAKTAMDRLTFAFSLVDSSQPHSSWPNPRDIDDQHLFVAAKRCNAEVVVSGNVRDFPPQARSGKHAYGGVEYITYPELLTRLNRTQEGILARAQPRSGFFEYHTSLVERFDRYPASGEKVVVDSDILQDAKKRDALISATRKRLIVPFWSPRIIGELFHLSVLERFEQLQIARSSDRLLDVIEQKVLSRESKELMHLLTAHFFLANPFPPADPPSKDGDRDDGSLLETAKFCGATMVISERHEVGKRIRDGVERLTYQELFDRIGEKRKIGDF